MAREAFVFVVVELANEGWEEFPVGNIWQTMRLKKKKKRLASAKKVGFFLH